MSSKDILTDIFKAYLWNLSAQLILRISLEDIIEDILLTYQQDLCAGRILK